MHDADERAAIEVMPSLSTLLLSFRATLLRHDADDFSPPPRRDAHTLPLLIAVLTLRRLISPCHYARA